MVHKNSKKLTKYCTIPKVKSNPVVNNKIKTSRLSESHILFYSGKKSWLQDWLREDEPPSLATGEGKSRVGRREKTRLWV